MHRRLPCAVLSQLSGACEWGGWDIFCFPTLSLDITETVGLLVLSATGSLRFNSLHLQLI